MRRLMTLAIGLVIVAGIILMGTQARVFAQDIKVGAVINLTGPASTWGQPVLGATFTGSNLAIP